MWVSIDSEAACSAALHQALDEIRIAGCGAFFGLEHSYNCSFALDGVQQDAARAEVRAILKAARLAWRKTILLVNDAAQSQVWKEMRKACL